MPPAETAWSTKSRERTVKNTFDAELGAAPHDGFLEIILSSQRRRLFDAFMQFKHEQGGEGDSILDVEARSPLLQENASYLLAWSAARQLLAQRILALVAAGMLDDLAAKHPVEFIVGIRQITPVRALVFLAVVDRGVRCRMLLVRAAHASARRLDCARHDTGALARIAPCQQIAGVFLQQRRSGFDIENAVALSALFMLELHECIEQPAALRRQYFFQKAVMRRCAQLRVESIFHCPLP